MPELPEVENTCRDLHAGLGENSRLEKIEFRRADLRDPMPKKKLKSLEGQKFLGVARRAKYILLKLENGIMLSHLGMTGQWRFEKGPVQFGIHDHVALRLSEGKTLVFRDPRRFGVLDFVQYEQENSHKRLKHLGLEPLDPEFTAEALTAHAKKSTAPIKSLLMNQEIVVGVGNIYVAEALFRAGIQPRRPSRRVKQSEIEKLIPAIREILQKAIEQGGSTIRDYRRADASEGGFQDFHQVYGRAGEECRVCNTVIRNTVISGRSSFWCPKCQS